MLSNLSFGHSYHFINKQNGILCAYCGGMTYTESDIKKLHAKLLPLKGREIAETLKPYLKDYKIRPPKALLDLIELSERQDFQDKTFKAITLHLQDPKVFDINSNKTLWNIMNDGIFSVDHVQPRALEGKSEQCNYLPMHRYCNSRRGHRSYGELLAIKPDFIEHLRTSLMQLKRLQMLNPKCLPENYTQTVKSHIIEQGIPEELLKDI